MSLLSPPFPLPVGAGEASVNRILVFLLLLSCFSQMQHIHILSCDFFLLKFFGLGRGQTIYANSALHNLCAGTSPLQTMHSCAVVELLITLRGDGKNPLDSTSGYKVFGGPLGNSHHSPGGQGNCMLYLVAVRRQNRNDFLWCGILL